jgi:hypothetical protein
VGTVQILPYWTCPSCHVGRVVHLATGILVLQVLFSHSGNLTLLYRLSVDVVVDHIVSKCDSEAARGKLNIGTIDYPGDGCPDEESGRQMIHTDTNERYSEYP